MNNAEREQWVLNHEPLYQLHQRSELPMGRFLRAFRNLIDAVIKTEMERKPSQ